MKKLPDTAVRPAPRKMLAAACAAAISLALAAPTRASPPAIPDTAPLLSAERAFAARAAAVGVEASFLESMAPDAMVLRPDPVSAHTAYTSRPPRKPPAEGGPLLAWSPRWVGIARSGDLGFTTGPARVNGKPVGGYVTVWRKQPDGSWKWIFDGGVPNDSDAEMVGEGPVPTLAASLGPAPGAARATAEVAAAEAALSDLAAKDAPTAYARVLGLDAHLLGSAAAPADTPAAVEAELHRRPAKLEFTPLGVTLSEAGDLAWTYGRAQASAESTHYVRIWQRRGGSWKLVLDALMK